MEKMKMVKGISSMIVLMLMMVLPGCPHQARVFSGNGEVISMSNDESLALNAVDVVNIMRRAGFTDDEILELGTDLRNAIVQTGAAQIRIGQRVEALLAVKGDYVFVSSYRRGSFTYNVSKSLAPSDN